MSIFTKADWSRGVTLRSKATRAPISLAGWALEMVVKATRADDAALATLSTANGGLVIDSVASGRFEILMTAEQTTAIGAGDRVFAIYRTDNGQRQRLMSGRLTVAEGI